MRLSAVLVLSAVVVGMGAVGGCSNWGHDKNVPLIAAANSPIADVPVPVGFTMTPDSSSKVVPGNALRFVDHRYTGSDETFLTVKFFKDHLPEYKWVFADQNQNRGNEVVLHYTKGNEHLYVTVSEGTWGKTYVRVKIDPAGRDAQR